MTRHLRALDGRVLGGIAFLAGLIAVAGLATAVDGRALADGVAAARDDLPGLALALVAFGFAFVLRAAAWQRTLPGLSFGHALAGIHLALGGNHVLPARLGEPLRAISVVRRAGVAPSAALTSTVALRTADLCALLLLGAVLAPALLLDRLGTVGLGLLAVLLVVCGLASWRMTLQRRAGSAVRPPGPVVLGLTTAAWGLEALLVAQVLDWFDIGVGPSGAVIVLACAVGAQLVAIAPGGLGTYEAAAATALVALGADLATALAAAVAIHGLKTIYSLAVGLAAMGYPAPAIWGRLRLPTTVAVRRPHAPAHGPVVLFLPAHDEGPRVAAVVRAAPRTVLGRPVEVIVVDDGSADDTAAQARRAGADVVRHARNLGLGAAVRTGLAEATARGAAAVAFCDADGEYDPGELERLVAPVLAGDAEYVVGSRFDGHILHMRPHRRLGNLALTAWLRWTVRRPVTDGQSGFRAFSGRAAASAAIPHDYNYAQVLTVDLLARGFAYTEVPITYAFRRSGRSFVRLGRYLRRVLPTVWRQLNPAPTATPQRAST